MTTTLTGIITGSGGDYEYIKWESPSSSAGLFKCVPDGYTYSGVVNGQIFYTTGYEPISIVPPPSGIYTGQISVDFPFSSPLYLCSFPKGTRISDLRIRFDVVPSGGYNLLSRTLGAQPFHGVNDTTFLDYETVIPSGNYVVSCGSYMVTPQFTQVYKLGVDKGNSNFDLSDILTTTHSGNGEEWTALDKPIYVSVDSYLALYNSHYANDFRGGCASEVAYSVAGDVHESTSMMQRSDVCFMFSAKCAPLYSIGDLTDPERFMKKRHFCLGDDIDITLNVEDCDVDIDLYLFSDAISPDTFGRLIIYVDYLFLPDYTIFNGYSWTHNTSSNTLSGAKFIFSIEQQNFHKPRYLEGKVFWHSFESDNDFSEDLSGNGYHAYLNGVLLVSGVKGYGISSSDVEPYGFAYVPDMSPVVTDCSFSFWIKPKQKLTASSELSCLIISSSGNTDLNSMIPDMVSDTSPPPYVVSASNAYSSSYAPYKAFNSNDESWMSYSIPNWLQIDLGDGNEKFVQSFRLKLRDSSYYRYAPRDFSFQASDDGSKWVTLRTFKDFPDVGPNMWTAYYSINTPSGYRYYRLYFTRSWYGDGYSRIAVNEWELIEKFPGRFGIAYNYVDIDSYKGRTDDGRLWFYTDVLAKGTDIRVWESDRWYFIEVGFIPGASGLEDYLLRVNGVPQTGYLLGSGVASDTIIENAIEYLHPTFSGVFYLDEVILWDRFLSPLESLNIAYPLGTDLWLDSCSRIFQEGFSILELLPSVTVSGVEIIDDSIIQQTFNLMKCPGVSSRILDILIPDASIRRNLLEYDHQQVFQLFNFLRYASGWVDDAWDCWGCKTGKG
jgi:hypothetical protein